MIPRLLALSVLAVGLTAAGAEWGRNPQQNKGQPPQASPQQVTINGTIERVAPSEIQVTTTRGRRQRPGPTWLVTPQANAKLVVTGTAKADYLRPHMLIQFRAELDDKNKAKEEVSELSVMTTSRDNPLGIFADQGGIRPPADPGVGAGRVKPDAQAEKDLAPLDRAAPKTARIVGKIATLKDKHVAVQIGSKTVEFDLADDPVINYSLSDPKLVATGSKVVVKGMGVRGRPNRCQADTITVTRLDVLEGKKKPANPGSAADKADGKTAAGKDPEKPGE